MTPIKEITKNIYQTHFTNMMPQRGFLVSAQSFITIIDIDLTYDDHFILKYLKEEDFSYFFIKNGPMKINPFQKSFTLETTDESSFKELKKYNFYKIKNFSVSSEAKRACFLNQNFEYEKIPFKREIKNNKIIFKITKNVKTLLSDTKLDPYSIIFAQKNNINPLYNNKLHLDLGESMKKYNTEGYENVLLHIDNVFKKNKLSGKLYKTRNGLRIILNDKFRSLLDKKNLGLTLHIMKEFLMDELFVSFYEQKEKSHALDGLDVQNRTLINYLARLTPKLKNYKYFFKDTYEEVYKDLDVSNISSIYVGTDILPLKYDFKKVTYNCNKSNSTINNSFNLLKKLIFLYLNTNTVAVCRFIKSYNYGGENEFINQFIHYHDQWTKAHLSNATLI